MLRHMYNRARNQLRRRRLGLIHPDKRIFFMHIPKTGGTSFDRAIAPAFETWDPKDDRRIQRLDTHAVFDSAQILGRDYLDASSDISVFYLAGKRFRYLSGHFTFNEKAYEHYGNQYYFVTVLRDPVKKWLSLYFYSRFKEGDFFRVSADLESFVQTEEAEGWGQDYVMQFMGDRSSGDFTSQESIQRAIRNLNKFHLVGCLEKLDVFVDEFQAIFGARLEIPRLRTSPLDKAERDKQLTPEIMQRIQEICRPNYEVYNWALQNLIGTYKATAAQPGPVLRGGTLASSGNASLAERSTTTAV